MSWVDQRAPLVSVIAPAFNARSSAERAVSALRAQTFSDFELIICDDGSSDGTLEACDAAAEGDSRVRLAGLFHGGVCSARNAGLDLACGELIAFLDMDDVPHPTWLETLVRGMKGTERARDAMGAGSAEGSESASGAGGSEGTEGSPSCDLSVCGYEVRDARGALMHDTLAVCGTGADVRRLSADEFRVALFSNSLMYQGYVWNKLFRRSLVEQWEPLRFKSGVSRNEDRLFVFEYLERARAVAWSGEPCYTYFDHPLTGAYQHAWASELVAFDVMAERLDAASSSAAAEALRFAERDCYRATAALFESAFSAGHEDAAWLAERLCALSGRGFSFEEYPEPFQLSLERALLRAQAVAAAACRGGAAAAVDGTPAARGGAAAARGGAAAARGGATAELGGATAARNRATAADKASF